MSDEDPIETPARRRRKTPQQRKAEEYANDRVSRAEHPHVRRVSRPRQRARGHRRERRAVAQVLRQAPTADVEALTTRAREAPIEATLWSDTTSLPDKLQGARARRTLAELAAALGQGSEPPRTDRARAVLLQVLRTRQHGERLASDLEAWIAGSYRDHGFRPSFEPVARKRLRSMLRADPDLLTKIHRWITACGVLPRSLESARVVRRERSVMFASLLPRPAPAWADLRDQFRAWRLKGPPAGAKALLQRAKSELLAWPSWQREVGGLVVARGITYSVRLDSRGRMIVLPSSLAGGIRRRTQEDAKAVLGRGLEHEEAQWLARFGTIGSAEATLREWKQVEPSRREGWLTRRVAEWRGVVKAPRRREAPPRRPRGK